MTGNATVALSTAPSLKKDGVDPDPNKDIIALIAYLQRLGTDIRPKEAK